MTNDKNLLVRIGDFFFKWRNIAFPVILVSLFVAFPPPDTIMGSAMADGIRDALAGALILAGLAFRVATIGWAYIKRGGLNKQVYADTLVISGFFGLCRNPLYVGNMMVYAGIFMLHGHPVVTMVGIALYAFIYVSIIAAEEHYLRAKFGADYEEYCRRVPRWLPDFSRYRESVQGMSFSVMRAIAKDYTTISNAFLAIIVIELIERYVHRSHQEFMHALAGGALLIGLLFCAVIGIKLLKKSGRLKEAA